MVGGLLLGQFFNELRAGFCGQGLWGGAEIERGLGRGVDCRGIRGAAAICSPVDAAG